MTYFQRILDIKLEKRKTVRAMLLVLTILLLSGSILPTYLNFLNDDVVELIEIGEKDHENDKEEKNTKEKSCDIFFQSLSYFSADIKAESFQGKSLFVLQNPYCDITTPPPERA